jgi:putative spermidine/putrescine transport system permease protein
MRHRPSGPALLLFVYMALFMLFITLPIAAVVVISFSSSSYIAFPMPGLSLKWYRHIIEYRPFVTSLLLAPISVPAIVLGFALLYFLSALSFGLSFGALLVAHTIAGIPYIVRTVLATYRAVPGDLEESASILGASRAQVLWHLTLPMVRPGIFAGGMFAVLTSLDNLPLSFFFGTATTNTLPVVMLSYMENQFDPSIAAISTVQMLIAVTCLFVLDRIYGVERLTAF